MRVDDDDRDAIATLSASLHDAKMTDEEVAVAAEKRRASFTTGFVNGSVRLKDLQRDCDSPSSPGSRSSSVTRATLATGDSRAAFDRESIGSSESAVSGGTPPGGQSKFAALFEKAKSKLGKKRREKNTEATTPQTTGDSSTSFEPRVVLRHANHAIITAAPMSVVLGASEHKHEKEEETTEPTQEITENDEITSFDSPPPPSASFLHRLVWRCFHMPFFKHRMVLLVALVAMAIAFPGFFTGFLWGVYLCFVVWLYYFVSDPITDHPESGNDDVQNRTLVQEEIQRIAGMKNVVYKGWMNELRGRYSPAAYHVNHAQSVLVRLDGNLLRIARPARHVLKHAFHTDATLTGPEPTMQGQSIYDLTDAQVALRPRRLAARRWWSRKYPIRIRLASTKSEVSRVDASEMSRSQSAHINIAQLARERRTASSRRNSAAARISHGSVAVTTTKSAIDETAVDAVSAIDERGSARESDDDEEEDETCSSDSEEEPVMEDAISQSTNSIVRSSSANEMSAFAIPGNNNCNENVSEGGYRKPRRARTIYLFVRAAREKERWFHRLREACSRYRTARLVSPSPDDSGGYVQLTTLDDSPCKTVARSASVNALPTTVTYGVGKALDKTHNLEYFHYLSNNIQFGRVMADLLKPALVSLLERGGCMDVNEEMGQTVFMDLGRIKWHPTTTIITDSANEENTHSPEGISVLLGVNAIASRIFFDFCRDAHWVKCVREKIQAKISTIHLPYFIETLELSHLDMGTTTPHIVGIHAPSLDEWGLWLDLEMRYTGGIRLVLETRVNLLKLKSGATSVAAHRVRDRWTKSIRVAHYSDEDLPESPESSPDEDFGSKSKPNDNPNKERGAGKKLLSFVDRIAQSNLFQAATELSAVHKVMEGISSTRLMLNVEVTALEGTLAINIPPPPSDRLWYGFRRPPRLSLHAVPRVGDRTVDISSISDWIEGRLRVLLEKNLVCPNMDDVIVPVMSGNVMFKTPYNI